MTGFSLLDWLTLIFFGLAWFGYEFVVDRTSVRRRSLSVAIDRERHHWMQEMALVDNRIMDSNLHASFQNGTAFFASTSLLAICGALGSVGIEGFSSVMGCDSRLGWKALC